MVTENVADLRNPKNVFCQKRKERGKVLGYVYVLDLGSHTRLLSSMRPQIC